MTRLMLLTLFAFAQPVLAAVLTGTNSVYANSDGLVAHFARDVTFSTGKTVHDVDITVDWGMTDGPCAFSEGALSLSHGGTTVWLTWPASNTLEGGAVVKFDDEAGKPLTPTVVDCDGVFRERPLILSGTFHPYEALSAFDGMSAAGVWTLGIHDFDLSPPNTYFNSFTIKVVAIPEPGSIALLGLGLTGLALVRRRRVK